MSYDLLVVNTANAKYSVSGRFLGYTIEIYHKGLNEHKVLSAADADILQNKVNLQANRWDEKWTEIENKQKSHSLKEENTEIANAKTEEAIESIKYVEGILFHTLDVDDTINWNSLYDRKKFPEKNPELFLEEKLKKVVFPGKPEQIPYKLEPSINDVFYKAEFTFWDKIFKSSKKKKIKRSEELYKTDIIKWQKINLLIDEENEQNLQKYKKEYNEAKLKEYAILEQHKVELQEYNNRLIQFKKQQTEHNEKIKLFLQEYTNKDTQAIIEYCNLVLTNSEYPESFPKEFELDFNPNNGLIIVEYQLPKIEDLPSVKEVKYIASKDEFKETYIPESQLTKMYDGAIYQIALRTIHEIFEADSIAVVEMVAFNGWVKAINKATGKEENNCILSIQTNKKDFLEIDLRNVDPKICFKNLKGVAASKLSSLTPVQPLINISKEDKRFVSNNEVLENVDNSQNLASMDWEDFEHLIREIFEKEFKSSGGEVKITQASRDGGVDAIAFDPDPIRGGKIVIQAKRYTNTVGVSAVRDLYGTLMNEGATKGILVTTADYGSDAYEFAKGKPITLLNGANLLFLLEKHGYHAKIDIKEAKKLFNERV